jgi:hypothetical protein
LYHAVDFRQSTLLDVDAELHRNFAGLIPGTVSIVGYSELIAEHMRSTTPRLVTTLSSTRELPFVSGNKLLERISRLRLGLEFTDQAAYTSLREFLGPDETTWLSAGERYRLSNQIRDICMALNRRENFEDFTATSSIGTLAVTEAPAGMGIWNFLYQIVLGYELYLRLQSERDTWVSGVNEKVSATVLISKQWIENVDMMADGNDSSLRMRSHVQARQVEGLLRFGEIMKWPYLGETRDFVENAYLELLGGKTVGINLWDWLFGVTLPGKWFSFKIMTVLVTATPSLSNHGAAPYFNSGISFSILEDV